MLASGLFALDFHLSVNLNVALEVHSFVQHGSSLIRIRFHSQKHSKMLEMYFFFFYEHNSIHATIAGCFIFFFSQNIVLTLL